MLLNPTFLFWFFPVLWLVARGWGWVEQLRWRSVGVAAVSLLVYGYFSQQTWWLPWLMTGWVGLCRWMGRSDAHHAKVYRAIGVAVVVMALVYVKAMGRWWNFGTGSWQGGLPAGLSVMTLLAVSALMERRKATLAEVGGYIANLATLTAGPISLFSEYRQRNYVQRWIGDSEFWVRLFIQGLFKKLVVAETLADMTGVIFRLETQASGWLLLVGVVAYTVQIYFDFSGYTDLARGVAGVLGVWTQENFHAPYLASSAREFWRRWHVSFMAWLKTYVYIPLGGSRRGWWRLLLSTLTVFVISGLWHGWRWNFGIWGIYWALVVLAERWYKPERWLWIINRLYMVIILGWGWLLFMSPDLIQWWEWVGRMIRWPLTPSAPFYTLITPKHWVVLIAGWVWTFVPIQPLFFRWWRRLNPGLARICWWGILAWSLAYFARTTYQAFIYQRF